MEPLKTVPALPVYACQLFGGRDSSRMKWERRRESQAARLADLWASIPGVVIFRMPGRRF